MRATCAGNPLSGNTGPIHVKGTSTTSVIEINNSSCEIVLNSVSLTVAIPIYVLKQ
jgi:hypothetical protein